MNAHGQPDRAARSAPSPLNRLADLPRTMWAAVQTDRQRVPDHPPAAPLVRNLRRRPALAWLLVTTFLTTPLGCAAYRVGAASLYPGHIRTVHVPVFRSDSIRRDLSEWLTEAVVKEIELKTDYKVVGRDQADTILEGVLIWDEKSVLAETSGDQPRALDVSLLAHVRWINRQGQLLSPEMHLPLPDTLTVVEESAILVPEVGQSLVSSQQQVIHRMAEQIVAMMEVAW
ncbi:MAG: hypothetical protein GTO03_08950 [Planctomycetales bacterium]|nr:hypothetical protein [Planctomycetales bacterium]